MAQSGFVNDQSIATEDALRRAVDATPAFIHTGRPDGYLDYFNRGWLDFLGKSLVFFSLIEVLITTILDNNRQIERAKKIDRYCRVIVPAVFVIASIAIFAHPRG